MLSTADFKTKQSHKEKGVEGKRWQGLVAY